MGITPVRFLFTLNDNNMQDDFITLLIFYLFVIVLANILLFVHTQIPKEKRSYYDLIDKDLEYCIVYLSFIPLYNLAVVALIITSLLFNIYNLIRRL